MSNLVRISHGLWRPPEEAEEYAARCAAVLTAMPDGTDLCGMTAARMHGLWVPSDASDRIEVVLRRSATWPRELPGSRRAEVRARRRTLTPQEIGSAGGLPATSPVRTWVDLAERLSVPDLIACGDSVLRGDGSMAQLALAVSEARGRRGVRMARSILDLDLLDQRSRSRAESHLRYAVVSSGLPKPEVNRAVHNEVGEWLAEPDLHYRGAKLAIECNGADHANTKRMRNDMTRSLGVQWDGWRVIDFGPTQVFGRPWEIGPLVRVVLGNHAPDFLREWREINRVARNSAPLGG